MEETDTVEAGDCVATKLRTNMSHRDHFNPVIRYKKTLMLQHVMTEPTCMNTRRPNESLARHKNGTTNTAKPRDVKVNAPEIRAYCVTADLHVHDNAMLGSHLSVLTPAHCAPATQSTAIKDVFPERNPFPTERRNAHE